MKWVQRGLNITRIDQLLLWEGSVLVAIVLSFVSAVAPSRDQNFHKEEFV